MDLGFKGEVAVVTGASKGIGAACARLLALEGAHLVLVARNKVYLDNLAKELLDKSKTEVVSVSADLSKIGSAEKVVKAAVEKFGRIDVLINSAGSSQGGIFDELPEHVWNDALQLKFLGAVRMVRAVLPVMRAQQHGRIVNIAGNTGRQPHPRLLPGSAANAALLSFTRGLSEEIIKDGIYINALQPGPTNTEHWDTLMERLSKGTGLDAKSFEVEFMKQIPIGRIADASEMAATTIFMASKVATYMTGRSIVVDGGWTKDMA